MWAGANDYLSGGAINLTQAIANLTHAVQSLAAVDAKQIMVVNLPDLSDLPATRNEQSPPFLSKLR